MKQKNALLAQKLCQYLVDDHVDKITFKPLFGGLGVCFKGVMFAWIYEDNLYLKAHDDYLLIFNQHQMPLMKFNSGVVIKLLQYYQVTEHLWQNENELKKMLSMVITHVYANKETSKTLNEPRLKDLPNMTTSLERSLFKVGISNLNILKKKGPYQAYFLLKKENKNISENVLLNLYCTLKHVHVATLTPLDKETIKSNYQLKMQSIT